MTDIDEEMNTPQRVAFWTWLPLAYRDGHIGTEAKFTKYNMEVSHAAGCTAALQAQAQQIANLTAERDEFRALFDLIWNADMRAIQMWKDANPGNGLVWPDGANLKLWLMGQLDRAEAENARLREALSVYADGCDADDPATCQWEGQMCCKTARAAMKGGDNG